MTTQRPDDRPIAGDRPHDDAAMDTFRLPVPPRPLARLFGRSPLIRAADRVEALILVLAFVVSALALPVAAAVGTTVHESRSRSYAEQARTHHTVVATITGDSDARQNLASRTANAPARWYAAGAEHTGTVIVERTAKPGDQVEIWVDDAGSPTSKPVLSALDEAVATAVSIWLGVAIAAAALYWLARTLIDRSRDARWQRDFDRMVRADL